MHRVHVSWSLCDTARGFYCQAVAVLGFELMTLGPWALCFWYIEDKLVKTWKRVIRYLSHSCQNKLVMRRALIRFQWLSWQTDLTSFCQLDKFVIMKTAVILASSFDKCKRLFFNNLLTRQYFVHIWITVGGLMP